CRYKRYAFWNLLLHDECSKSRLIRYIESYRCKNQLFIQDDVVANDISNHYSSHFFSWAKPRICFNCTRRNAIPFNDGNYRTANNSLCYYRSEQPISEL